MDNLAKRYDEILTGISSSLKKHGVTKQIHYLESNFHKLTPHRQAQVLKRSSLQLEQMELLDPSLSQEDYINTLCRFHRLKPMDHGIYSRLTDDMFWEILDFDFNQIYRNKLVYKLTNYCISQLEENTPFELYDRPKKALEQLMEVVQQLKVTTTTIDMTHIKPYILKELKSDAHGMLQVQHQFACPLVDINTGETKAFVAGLKGLKLAVGKENANILVMS